jgi:ABC-type sugar transport system ATPase subunit
MCQDAEKVLNSLMVDIEPTEKVENLSTGQKQIVEIARATHRGTKVVIMDEPNSALNDEETKVLFRIIKNLKECGTTVIYVSHRLEEVFKIADRISVLRDGQYMGTWDIKNVSVEDIVAQVVGRRLGEIFPPKKFASKDSKVSLEVKGLHLNGDQTPIEFSIRKGEILGFAGLQGSGVQEIFDKLFGIEKHAGDLEVLFNGKKIKKIDPVELIGNGWGLIPADRREEGLMLDWSILKNVSIVIVGRLLNRLGLINHRKEREVSEDYINQLSIATDSIDKKVINLSGGNQQKVVLAKWLSTEPKLLILNDPTRGIDVGTKQEIYRLIANWAKQGYTILFTSSEIEEVLGVSHRVLVMYKGKMVKEFSAKQADKEDVMEYVLGGAALINEEK